MVQIAGNHSTGDFLKYGGPIKVVMFGAAIVILTLRDSSWLVAGISVGVAFVWVAGMNCLTGAFTYICSLCILRHTLHSAVHCALDRGGDLATPSPEKGR